MNWIGLYLGSLAAALLAILPIVNPFGAVPLVISASGHLPEQERLRQIRRACVYTFFLMAGFLVAGGLIMNFFGISLPGMRIAGGLIVAFLGFQMLFPNPISDKEAMTKAAGEKYDIAFTPLAMPGLSGPGTFAVVMSLSSQAASHHGARSIVDFLGVLTAIFLTALLSWFVLRGAERVNRLLGATGMVALTRLTGFLMISIGVQFLINGLTMILDDPVFWSGPGGGDPRRLGDFDDVFPAQEEARPALRRGSPAGPRPARDGAGRALRQRHRLEAPFPAGMQLALFGLGCFWGAERKFWTDAGRLHAPRSATRAAARPTRPTDEVCTRHDRAHRGRAGRVRPGAASATRQLLQIFWEAHDPTQGMRQGNDVGTQYRSGIYVYATRSARAAERLARRVRANAARGGLRPDHDRDPRRAGVLLRRGLPPAVPGEEPRRLLRPRRHRRVVPRGAAGRVGLSRSQPAGGGAPGFGSSIG